MKKPKREPVVEVFSWDVPPKGKTLWAFRITRLCGHHLHSQHRFVNEEKCRKAAMRRLEQKCTHPLCSGDDE